MSHPLHTKSTLTDRYQTTIPDVVRKALHLKKRDKIQYTVQANGHVTLSKIEDIHTDPIIDNFLNFIAQDMQQHPQHLASINPSLLTTINSLVNNVKFNLDEKLDNDA